MVKREEYLKRIRPFMHKEVVKVLTGIRRCGKSVLLELIKKDLIEQGVNEDHFLSVNFETGAFSYVKSAEETYHTVKEFVKTQKEKVYLFFDEIQELPGWEKVINSLMIDFDVDIYITGSNAKMLSGELATYLGGRYVEFKIYPFSFAEVLEAVPEQSEAEVFQTYLTRGGMPFLYQFPFDDESSKQYLRDIYDSIVLKDIVQRNKIRDVEQFKRVLLYFIAGIGTTFSAGNIVKYMKSENRTISAETLYNYLEYCQTACLLHMVTRADVLGKKLLKFQEKSYIADHGIREAVYGNNMRDIQQTLENIVYMELRRRGYEIYIGKAERQEVDFVAQKGSEKCYIQITYLLASEETVEREFSVLEKIPDNYPKYVVSMDEINRSRNGIKHMNIRKFLLLDSYI